LVLFDIVSSFVYTVQLLALFLPYFMCVCHMISLNNTTPSVYRQADLRQTSTSMYVQGGPWNS